jgi:hypothetical protein
MCSADTYCQFSTTDTACVQQTHTVSSCMTQAECVQQTHTVSSCMTKAECVQQTHTVSSCMTQAECVQQTSCTTDAACFQQQHYVRSCMSDTATNIYDSDNLSLQTQPEQLTFRLRLEPRTCQVQSSSKDLTLTMRAHYYLFLHMLVFVSPNFYEQHTHTSAIPLMNLLQSRFPVIFLYEFTTFAPDITSLQLTNSSLFQVHQMTVRYGSCCSHNVSRTCDGLLDMLVGSRLVF